MLLILSHIGDMILNGLFFLRAFIFAAFRHLANVIDALGMFAQDAVMEARGIATEHYVGATTGHIGGDRDSAATSRLSNDLSFVLMVLGVEDVVWYALHLQHSRQVF